MKTKIFTVIAVFLVFFSCSKEPVPERMDIDLIFSIEGNIDGVRPEDYERKFTSVSDIEVDSEDNIYIFNPRLQNVLKFDESGEFIKQFGEEGTGRGQLRNAVDMAIMKDTLYIRNNYTPFILRFSPDGEFIDGFGYEDGKMHLGEIIRTVSDDKFIGYRSSAIKSGDTVIHTNKLVILDDRHKQIAVLREYTSELDQNNPQFLEFMTKYAVVGSKIYVAENSEDEYLINVFDLEGKKTAEIKRPYKRIKFNEQEMGIIKSLPLAVRKSRDSLKSLEPKAIYKKSINALFYDKYGRLIVCPSVKRTEKNQDDFIADIFEDGKFVKRVVIPQLKGEDMLYRTSSDIYFIGDRIYEVINDEMKVNVYGY